MFGVEELLGEVASVLDCLFAGVLVGGWHLVAGDAEASTESLDSLLREASTSLGVDDTELMPERKGSFREFVFGTEKLDEIVEDASGSGKAAFLE